MGVDFITAGYAATVALGGIMGFVKAGSTGSLAAGLFFGTILGYGAYQTSVNPDNYLLSFGASTVLGGVMGFRFYSSGKFMPAGLISIMSLAIVTRFAIRALTAVPANQGHRK